MPHLPRTGFRTGFLLLCFLVLSSLPASAGTSGGPAPERVVLTTLEWVPYTGSELPGLGVTAEVARAAFQAVGIELEIRFYPWNRAVDEARFNPEVAGYFPEYQDAGVSVEFLLSEPVGWGLLGVIASTRGDVALNTVHDLKGLRVGVVSGYVNTEEFDRMAARRELLAVPVMDDATNVRMVAMDRLDAALIDPHVFHHLMRQPGMELARGKVRFLPEVLAHKTMHLCFRKGPEGERLAALFNEGLGRIDAEAMQRERFEAMQCSFASPVR